MWHVPTHRSGKVVLTDVRMHDGSPLFASLPMSVLGHVLYDHAGKLRRAEITDFLCADGIEVWLDFRYRTHDFTINAQLGEYWFFVDDPGCPDDILREVVGHFSALLGGGRIVAKARRLIRGARRSIAMAEKTIPPDLYDQELDG